jgi:hypothetical protein
MSKSIKQHDVASSKNRSARSKRTPLSIAARLNALPYTPDPERVMNAVVNRSLATEQEVTEVPAALARWYAANSSIRRLWAIEDPIVLIVFVALEPTSDGDDALPVWLANNRAWANDLRLLTNRDVQLKPRVSEFEESYAKTKAVMIAELSWRDSWVSP